MYISKTTISLCVLFLFGNSIMANEAIVTFLKGKVYSQPLNVKTKPKLLKKGEKVSQGTTITTTKDSQITLQYEGSEFKIFQNSIINLNSIPTKEQAGDIEVSSGFSWFKIEKGTKGFTARTITSTVGVRGTAFATMYEPEFKTAMNCICHGKVEVKSKEGKSILLEQGYGSMIVAGKPEINTAEYIKDFEKKEVLPSFKLKIDSSPILKNCLSCHKTKGWTP